MARKKLARTVFGSDNDRGVSPVIGVILMVAITVILAAVIGTMVLGMTDNVSQNVQAGANVQYDETAGEITITYTSNQNADSLNATLDGGNSKGVTNVGETMTYSASPDTSYHVVVTAKNGQASTVVIDKTINT